MPTIQTILQIGAFVSFANVLSMLIGARMYGRQRHMAWWFASSLFLSISILLYALRGSVDDFWPVVVANVSTLVCAWTLFMGCRAFARQETHVRWWLAALVGVVATHLFFCFARDSYLARVIVMSVTTSAIALASALVLARAPGAGARLPRRLAVGLLTVIGLLQVARFAMALRGEAMTAAVVAGPNTTGPDVVFVITIGLLLSVVLVNVVVVMTGERQQEEDGVARERLDTATRDALTALRDSEERFMLAVEGSMAGLWSWDVRSDTFFISPLGKSLLGYGDGAAPASFVNWIERLYPDDQPAAREAIRTFLRGRETLLLLEYRLLHSDGTFGWVQSRGAARRDAAGRVFRIAGSIEDITERRQAADAQSFLTRHAHVGTGEGFFQSVCRYLAETLVADAVFVDRLSRDGLLAYGEAAFADGRAERCTADSVADTALASYAEDEVRVIASGARAAFPADGRLRQFDAESYVGCTLRNADGQPVGLISVLRRRPLQDAKSSHSLLSLFAVPVSGELIRKHADEALRVREAYSRTLLSSLPAGVVVHAADTTILDANDMACELLGLSLAQMQGKLAVDPAWAFLNEDRTPMPLEYFPVNRVVATGQPISGLVVGLDVPGRMHTTWVVCNAYPVHDRSGHLLQIVVTFVDVTQRIASEEARRELEAQLRQSQKMDAIGQLAGGIAHDFNNLLTVITGIADVTAGDPTLSASVRRDLEEIRRAGDRAALLTRQLLAFGRKQVMAPEVLLLRELIERLQPLLMRVIREDIQLVLEPGECDGEVMSDPGQIEQVLLNLALNARDAMPRGGRLTFSLTEVQVDEALARRNAGLRVGAYVRVNVHDTGVGMDDATRARMFEPFFTTKVAGKGTGLGLAMAYGIITQNRGAIDVATAPDEGSTISIYLPLVSTLPTDERGRPRPLRTPRETRTITPATGTHEIGGALGRILVVEDEIAIRRLAQRILEQEGYVVRTACDGIEALRVVAEAEKPFDLLLTDVIMPRMNGPELAARVTKIHPSTHVLFASGYSGNVDLRDQTLGASSNFLAKPYQAVELTQKVYEVMTSGRE